MLVNENESLTQPIIGEELHDVVEDDDGDATPPGEVLKGRATTLQTVFNLANELEGAGLLGLPYTFRLGGWASAACMVLCGTMAGFTGYCIAMCMYDEKGVRVRATYRSVGLACFGRAGELTVFLMQITNLVCVGVVFLVLIGSTLHSAHQLIGDESGSGDGASGSASILGLTISRADRRLWTALATCAALPTVHIGGFRKLAYLSMAGTHSCCS